MAEGGSDVTTCSVCFELYKETGDRVPRILPCTHTLCEKCVAKLLRDSSLRCPECRIKHQAGKGVKTFPQNKYILTFISKFPSGMLKLERCEKHKRPLRLFCIEPGCQKGVCLHCLKDDHKNHDFDDLEEARQEQCDLLLANVERLKENLQTNRVKFLAKKMEINRNTEACVQRLRNKKMEFMKMYDNLMKEASDHMAATNKKIDEEVSTINESMILLDSLKANTDATLSTQENIACKTEIVQNISDHIQRTMSGTRSYSYPEYTASNSVESVSGRLMEKETHIDLGQIMIMPQIKDGITEKKTEENQDEDLTRKLNSQVNVKGNFYELIIAILMFYIGT